MSDSRNTLCALSVTSENGLPVLAADMGSLSESRHSIDGLDVTIKTGESAGHVSVQDTPNAVSMDLLTFPDGLPAGRSEITVSLPDQWRCALRKNQVVIFKDRTQPVSGTVVQVSRNCWAKTTVDADLNGFSIALAQIEPGPCHLALASRPGNQPFLKSFKDVGAGETGGIKVGIDNLEYILFHLQSLKPESDPIGVNTDEGFAILRYVDDALDGYWRITENDAKAWT